MTCDGPLHKNKDIYVVGVEDAAAKEPFYLRHTYKSVNLFIDGFSFLTIWAMTKKMRPLTMREAISLVGKRSLI